MKRNCFCESDNSTQTLIIAAGLSQRYIWLFSYDELADHMGAAAMRCQENLFHLLIANRYCICIF